MKFYILLLLIPITLVNELWSQQKRVDIDLERNESIHDFLDLGSNGFIIKTGKDQIFNKDENWVVRHYKPNLELAWEVHVPKTEVTKNLASPLIASPSGDYVYQIENKGGVAVWSKGGMHISQINQEGKLRSWEIDPKILKDLDVSHFSGNGFQFCTDSYFYLMKPEEETNGFYRWDHKEWQGEKKAVNLPAFKSGGDDEYYRTWRFLGQSNGTLYYSGSSTTGAGGRNIRIFVVGIDEVNLEVKKEFSFDLNLEKGKFIYPYNNIIVTKEATNSEYFSSEAFELKTLGNSTRMDPNFGAYIKTVLDEVHGTIYLVGYYGNYEFSSNASKCNYEGYYIQKYNLAGELLWKVQKAVPAPLRAERIFDMTSYSFDHLLSFSVDGDESVNLSLRLKIPKSPAFIEKFASNGETIGSFRYPYKGDVDRNSLTTSYYYATHQEAKSVLEQLSIPLMASANVYVGKDSFVIIAEDKKKLKVSLYLF